MIYLLLLLAALTWLSVTGLMIANQESLSYIFKKGLYANMENVFFAMENMVVVMVLQVVARLLLTGCYGICGGY